MDGLKEGQREVVPEEFGVVGGREPGHDQHAELVPDEVAVVLVADRLRTGPGEFRQIRAVSHPGASESLRRLGTGLAQSGAHAQHHAIPNPPPTAGPSSPPTSDAVTANGPHS